MYHICANCIGICSIRFSLIVFYISLLFEIRVIMQPNLCSKGWHRLHGLVLLIKIAALILIPMEVTTLADKNVTIRADLKWSDLQQCIHVSYPRMVRWQLNWPNGSYQVWLRSDINKIDIIYEWKRLNLWIVRYKLYLLSRKNIEMVN